MGYDFGNPFSLLLLSNTVAVVVLCGILVPYRDRRAAQGAIGVLAGAATWSLADAIKLAAETAPLVLFWNRLSYVGVAATPPFFLLFVAATTDREEWIRLKYAAPVVGASLLAIGLALTNPWHDLWRAGETVTPGSEPPVLVAEFGVLHVLWDVYVLLVIAPIGLGVLATRFRQADSPAVRRQTAIVLLGLTIPLVTATLFALRFVNVDLTPFGFAALGASLAVAVTRYRLFDVVSVGRDVAFEELDSGVLVVGPDGDIADVNESAVDMLETPRETLLSLQFATLVERLPDVPDRLGTVTDTQETIAVTQDGATEYYDVRISPIESDAADAGRVVLFTDITDRVRRRERLEKQKATLEEQNERLDEFAGIVSHDLRNPIQIIETNLHLLEEDSDRVDAIADATERMEDLVDQLLTLARSGGEVIETEQVDLSLAATQAWATVDTGDANLVKDVSQAIDADPNHMRQALENLFRNAVEHARPDGPEQGLETADGSSTDERTGLTVTIGDLDDGFYVEDDGVGFPDEVLATESVVEHYRSQGRYGLQIVENIVEGHGWTLTVGEGADGGARFEIRTDAE